MFWGLGEMGMECPQAFLLPLPSPRDGAGMNRSRLAQGCGTGWASHCHPPSWRPGPSSASSPDQGFPLGSAPPAPAHLRCVTAQVTYCGLGTVYEVSPQQ